jgi:hypothetical protein
MRCNNRRNGLGDGQRFQPQDGLADGDLDPIEGRKEGRLGHL